jgi:hypothetical protein
MSIVGWMHCGDTCKDKSKWIQFVDPENPVLVTPKGKQEAISPLDREYRFKKIILPA